MGAIIIVLQNKTLDTKNEQHMKENQASWFCNCIGHQENNPKMLMHLSIIMFLKKYPSSKVCPILKYNE